MRLLPAILMIALLLVCAPAQAEQNFFIKKTLNRNVQEPEKPEAKAPLAVPNTSSDPTAKSVDGSAPSGATPITNAQANSFYDNCLTQKNATFTPNGQQMLCACTAAQMQKEMTVEDVQVMSQNSPEGQAMRDKMTLFVYAPCMKYPTHDLIYTRCIGDEKIKAAVKNPEALCKCMGDGMADFIEQRGPEQLVASLRQNPGNLDPLGTLMNSPAFSQQAQSVMQSCAPRGMQ